MTSRALRIALPALVFLTAASAGFPRPAAAGWPHSASTNLGVAASIAAETVLATCPDGAGGVIVIFQSSDPYGPGLYAQRLDAAGRALWGAGAAYVSAEMTLPGNCAIVPDGTGGATVVWPTYWTGNWNIQGARLNSQGATVWITGVCAAAGAQTAPVAVAGDAGSVIIAWQDARSGNSDIYAQKMGPGGTAGWTANGVAVTSNVNSQTEAVIAADGYGGAIIAFREQSTANGAEVYAQRVNSGGIMQWAAGGVVVVSAAGDQWKPAIITDANHGAIITWHDWRSGNADIYAQRLNSSGTAQWTTNGVVLCSAASDQTSPSICPDNSGGAIVAWQDARNTVDTDIYAQRVNTAGTVQWTANGVALCAAIGNQQAPVLAADGIGGAVAGWPDQRSGSWDICAQRVNSSGTIQWTTNGALVSTALWDQTGPVIVTDGGQGAILAWNDARADGDVYAQRLDEWGVLGAEPAIVKVNDVPGDQGGQLKVSWTASPLDSDPAFRDISAYLVFRSVPPQKARLVAVTRDPDAASQKGIVLATGAGDKTYYWEYVASQSAYHLPTYSYVVPTEGDSLAGKNPRTAVLIEARNAAATRWWFSQPDSGYSVDNLAPAAPAFLASRRAADATRVRWRRNAEADLGQYRLYRGASGAFTPGADNLVSAQADTGFVDVSALPYWWYKLTAVDIHGNESAVATLSPAQITAAPDGVVPAATALDGAVPNPFNPRTTIRYRLATAGPVTLRLYDAAGRLVRTLAGGDQVAGAHAVAWDGFTDAGGAAASGTYYCRLTAGTTTQSRPLTLLR